MSRYLTFCSRCCLPCGTGRDLCKKCKKVMDARKRGRAISKALTEKYRKLREK